MRVDTEADRLRPVEKAVSLVLRTGVLASAAVICLGLALLVLKGSLASYPRNLAGFLAGCLALDPGSVITLGLVVLVATPFARVAVSIVAFALEKDWRYVAITAIVLAILVTGIIMGKALG